MLRAPDGITGGRRLFDLTRGGHWTVLDFGAAQGLPASVPTVRVAGGDLASAYGATDRTLVLIRPDGHVGLISDRGDVAAVAAYVKDPQRTVKRV